MRLFFIIIALMAFCAVAYAGDSQLTGKWGVNGDVMYNFKPDGTGSSDGMPFRWRTANGVLYITSDGETEQVAYQVQGNTLTLSMGLFPMTLERIGKAPDTGNSAKSNKGMVSSNQGNNNSAGKDNLSKLLLSSAWCSFSYNQTTGYSHTKRVQFYQNGTWSSGSQGEGYSSGYGGNMASQHNSGGDGQWQVKGGQLYMSEAGGYLEPVSMQVNYNSNGSPILKADGVEYSQCQ